MLINNKINFKGRSSENNAMGNQEIKSAMSTILDRDFDRHQLGEYEAKLWREQTRDAVSGFHTHLNMGGTSWDALHPIQSKLNTEKSGIDNDPKRYSDQAREAWASGFTSGERKIATLKQGGK